MAELKHGALTGASTDRRIKVPPALPQLSKELEIIKKDSAPVLARAATLVVEDAQSYAIADSFLSRIVTTRKAIKLRLAKIIDPIKEALKEAKGLLDEADGPLELAEQDVRGKMKDFKLEEARQARIEEQKREEAAEELRRQANAKLLAEQKAKTQQMRDKLAAQRAELETKADVAAAAPAPEVVRAVGSTTRTVKVPRVTDMNAIISAVAAGRASRAILDVNMVALKALYKTHPEEVSKWPGIEWIDDIQIVKR